MLLMMLASGAGRAHQSVPVIGYAILVERHLGARERRRGRAPRPDGAPGQ